MYLGKSTTGLKGSRNAFTIQYLKFKKVVFLISSLVDLHLNVSLGAHILMVFKSSSHCVT